MGEPEFAWESCPVCGKPVRPGEVHSCRSEKAVDWDELRKNLRPGLKDMERENRIEALRAASRVVAGLAKPYTAEDAELDTLHLAEQFARWLEEG